MRLTALFFPHEIDYDFWMRCRRLIIDTAIQCLWHLAFGFFQGMLFSLAFVCVMCYEGCTVKWDVSCCLGLLPAEIVSGNRGGKKLP